MKGGDPGLADMGLLREEERIYFNNVFFFRNLHFSLNLHMQERTFSYIIMSIGASTHIKLLLPLI